MSESFSFPAHRVGVEFLQALFDPLERGGVGAQDPLQECRQKPWAVERACVARAGHPLGKLLEHRDGLVVGGDHPVFAHHALDSVQLAFVLVAR